jgi:hypothetical protein
VSTLVRRGLTKQGRYKQVQIKLDNLSLVLDTLYHCEEHIVNELDTFNNSDEFRQEVEDAQRLQDAIKQSINVIAAMRQARYNKRKLTEGR